MTLQPISSSITQAFSAGFDRLNQAAVKLTSRAEVQDSVELSPEAINASEDPMIAGAIDLQKSKLQIGVAAALMRTYGAQQKSLLDLLNGTGRDAEGA